MTDPSLAERNEMIAAMVGGGMSYHAVAREYGLTRERIRQICNSMGVLSPRAYPVYAQKKEQAIKLAKKGVGTSEIARRVGIDYLTVRKYAADLIAENHMCVDCSTSLRGEAPNKKRCEPCNKEHQKVLNRKYWRTNSMMRQRQAEYGRKVRADRIIEKIRED